MESGTISVKQAVFDYIQKLDSVSFCNLGDKFPALFKGGDQEMMTRENCVLWQGVTREGCDLLAALLAEKRIVMVPTTTLTYLIDGEMPEMPLAKMNKVYMHPRWYPVVFRTTERYAAFMKRRKR